MWRSYWVADCAAAGLAWLDVKGPPYAAKLGPARRGRLEERHEWRGRQNQTRGLGRSTSISKAHASVSVEKILSAAMLKSIDGTA